MSRTSQVICELGHWCNNGVLQTCQEGFFGNRRGLATELCTERCDVGYVCGKASISSMACPVGITTIAYISYFYQLTIFDRLLLRQRQIRNTLPSWKVRV